MKRQYTISILYHGPRQYDHCAYYINLAITAAAAATLLLGKNRVAAVVDVLLLNARHH